MGQVSQPHLDEDSRYLVYSAVYPVLDVWDLITLRGGPASPSITNWNRDGPSSNFTWILLAFLFSVAFCSEKTSSQNVAEIFHFCYSWADLIDQKWPYPAWPLQTWTPMKLIVCFALILYSVIWLNSYLLNNLFMPNKIEMKTYRLSGLFHL